MAFSIYLFQPLFIQESCYVIAAIDSTAVAAIIHAQIVPYGVVIVHEAASSQSYCGDIIAVLS